MPLRYPLVRGIKLGFFRNPRFDGTFSLYFANRVRPIEGLCFVGARFPRPTGWESQPLPRDTARCGLTNPQRRGITLSFLKQVLGLRIRQRHRPP